MTQRWYPNMRGFTGDAKKDDQLDKAFRVIYDHAYSLQGKVAKMSDPPAVQPQKQANPLATGISGVTPSLGPSQAPIKSSAQGLPGQVTYDSNYAYFNVGGIWKRVSLSTF